MKRRLQVQMTCVLVLILTAGALLLRAQFQEERRRSDLSPIHLPGGSVVEFKSFQSNSLSEPEPYSVFLPPSYEKSPQRTYPVVYFLHGLNNDQTSWTVERYGGLEEKIEQMINAGKIPEIIMVHPWGGNSFYCNYADGSKRFEDLISHELTDYMETNYRGRKGRENRALAGTSMGGYGALKIAMKYPDHYAAAAGMSPIIFVGKNPLDVPDAIKSSRYFQFFAATLTPLFGDPLRQDLWDQNNVLLLAKTKDLDGLKIYFDYGTADRYIQAIQLDKGVIALDRELTEAKVPHVFKVYEGEPHGWALVAAHLDFTLPFLCQTFH